MAFKFFKKKEPEEEEFISEEEKFLRDIERDTHGLGGPKPPGRIPPPPPAKGPRIPPPPPKPPGLPEEEMPPRPPAAPRPKPAEPPRPKPSAPPKTGELTPEQIAKLPLFMKVEDYDKIVVELTALVNSLKGMEQVMTKLDEIEKEETAEEKKWKGQLDKTKSQVRLLLEQLPEIGNLKNVIEEQSKEAQKKKAAASKKVATKKKEVEEEKKREDKIRKEIATLKKQVAEGAEIDEDVDDLKKGIQGLQDELKRMNLEFKMMSSLTQLKSSKLMKGMKKETEKKKAPKPKKVKSPWED